MTFISYAQNFEDIMLWRAFKHIENGFYIDVGAWSPDLDSVTRAFYEKNWRGINIEPNPKFHEQLVQRRASDINLKVAISDRESSMEMNLLENPGLSTLDDAIAAQHQLAGWKVCRQTVKVTTLQKVWQEHVPAGQAVHFLKVDVEGFEGSALHGVDWEQHRPWVVVVEATLPMSQVDSYADWEPILLAARYQLAYADGLNRFYVAKEHAAELLLSFKYPPNVFDGFKLMSQLEAEAKAEQAEAKAQQAEAKAQQAEAKAEQAEAKAQQAKVAADELATQLNALCTSASWRITRPLRAIRGFLRGVFVVLKELNSDIKDYLKKIISPWFVVVINYVRRTLIIKRLLKSVIILMPSLRLFLVKIIIWSSAEPCKISSEKLRSNTFYYKVFPNCVNVPETLSLKASPDFKKNTWIRLIGHVEGNYSLAIVNRSLASALEVATSGKIQFVPYEGKGYSVTPQLSAHQLNGIEAALNRRIDDSGLPIVSIVHHYPFINDPLPAHLRLILFPWEETSVPVDIVTQINNHFDGVLVPSASGKRALINSGCSLQVFVLPQGIDHLVNFDSNPISISDVGFDKKVRFLHVSSVFDRKGPDILLKGYLEAFTSSDNVELYIKTFPNPHNKIKAQLSKLIGDRKDAPMITIDECSLDSDQMRELYCSSHAMVLPTRGEGFNLPAAEAMALGLPVIVTGGSAQADFCTEQTATLIGYAYSPSRSHLHASDACWLEPDVSDLANKLRDFRNRLITSDVALYEQVGRGSAHVRDIYTWKNSAEGVLSSAEWLLKQRNTVKQRRIRLALISPWSTKCGIAEYAKMIMASLMAHSEFDVDIFCDSRTQTVSDGAEISWEPDNQDSFQKLIHRLTLERYDVVIIQHHPGLILLSDTTCKLLADLRSYGAVVILELHSTFPLIAGVQMSDAAAESLAKLDRIIVHQSDDLNNLLQLNLSDNVMMLPHGVIQSLSNLDLQEIRDELNLPRDAMVLGTFGFAMPHKGIDVIIRCIEHLRKALNREVFFLSLNSSWDDSGQIYIDELKALSKTLKVDNYIVWKNDFLPIKEVLRFLSCCDYSIFPYKHTQESASGAVTIGLATQRPVLVSELDIFADLSEVTYCIPDDKQGLVSAILCLENDKSLSDGLIRKQSKWLVERDWGSISSRFANLVRALVRDRVLLENIGRVTL